MYGTGYSGFTQWAAAKGMPPALKAIATSAATAPESISHDGNIFLNSAYRWAVCVTDTSGSDEKTCTMTRPGARSTRPGTRAVTLPGSRSPVRQAQSDLPPLARPPELRSVLAENAPLPGAIRRHQHTVLATTGYYAGDQAGALYYFTEHYRYDPHANHMLLIGPYDDGAMRRGRRLCCGVSSRSSRPHRPSRAALPVV